MGVTDCYHTLPTALGQVVNMSVKKKNKKPTAAA